MIRVLSVDAHPLLREGIAALVNAESDMKLVVVATNGQDAIEKFRLHQPDVTLMDLQMPAMNGIDAIIGIRSEFPDARIIVLTAWVRSLAPSPGEYIRDVPFDRRTAPTLPIAAAQSINA